VLQFPPRKRPRPGIDPPWLVSADARRVYLIVKEKCQSRMGNQSTKCGKWEILTNPGAVPTREALQHLGDDIGVVHVFYERIGFGKKPGPSAVHDEVEIHPVPCTNSN
jgi:hypothetical protein